MIKKNMEKVCSFKSGFFNLNDEMKFKREIEVDIFK
jgi:hypothetical protein